MRPRPYTPLRKRHRIARPFIAVGIAGRRTTRPLQRPACDVLRLSLPRLDGDEDTSEVAQTAATPLFCGGGPPRSRRPSPRAVRQPLMPDQSSFAGGALSPVPPTRPSPLPISSLRRRTPTLATAVSGRDLQWHVR